jgi:hypothetical protein
VLIPYVAAAALDDAAISAARDHFAHVAPSDAKLVEVGRFTEHVWLAPAPRERFVELIRSACRRFPDSLHGEEFPDPVPHLTVGQASGGSRLDQVAQAAEAELAPRLPVRFRVDSAWLLVEQSNGTWVAAERFPLGA